MSNDTLTLTHSMLTPDTLVAAINVDALPDGKGKTTILPGAAADPKNLLSDAQVKVIASYAHDFLEPTLTWHQAVAQIRIRAGIKSPRQFDFPMVEWIIRQGYLANAPLELTPSQEALRDTVMQALSGVTPHWDEDIRTAIANLDPTLKSMITARFIQVTNQGTLSTAMNLFTNLCGSPKPRNVLMDNPGNVPLGDGLDTVNGEASSF